MSGSNGNGNGTAAGGSRKRPSPLERARKKARDLELEPILLTSSECGPLYPVTSESILLKSKYPENKEDEWDKNGNPNGVVPVVVHPDLVKGLKDSRQGEAPKELTQEQKDGIQFLWSCYETGQGGILAHDMGLGKTRTGITFVATLLQQSKNSAGKSRPAIKKCLIIAPKNAVSVWHNEFDKWVPEDIPCKVVVIKPGQKDGWDVVNEFLQTDSSKNILIVSYETFTKYNSTYEEGFKKKLEDKIGVVICDEAHVLKNPDTARVKNLKTFIGAELWVGLTGTPFQNNLEELCNLVSFFRRDIFAPGEIKKLCKPITEALSKNKKLGATEKECLVKLKDKLMPALQIKKNCFNIKKHDIVLCVPLDGHPHYGQHVKCSGTDSVAGQSSSDEEDSLGNGVQHEMYRSVIECLEDPDVSFFEKLSYLHKACIHPDILYEKIKKRPNIFSKALAIYNEWCPEEERQAPELRELMPMYSAKISVVTRMAKHLKENFPDEKMIIVSSSIVLLGKIKDFFSFNNLKAVVYDGPTSDYAKKQNLEDFETKDNCRFLLLSLKAGSTALTLTRANHLVLMEPDYNPAHDRQAIARIYRPSQERTAFIYRLLATGTIEEVKFILQLEKEDMKRFFEPGGSVNIQSIYDETQLLEYKDESISTLRMLLDEMVIRNFNEEVFDFTLADELRESKQYQTAPEVPEYLSLVKKVWGQVSYAFHTAKIPENAQEFVLYETLEDDS